MQEQYLAQARDLFLSHDPHTPPITVGQPLPLDAAFYQRYQQGQVKVCTNHYRPLCWLVT